MQRAQRRGEAPVHFLRPRRVHVAGPQACFDVADRHARVERGERGRQRRRGIAVHEHQVRREAREHRRHLADDAAEGVGQRLPRAHDVEVGIRADIEHFEHLVEHLPMLRGHHHDGLQGRVRAQGMHHRRHLDGFRPRAEHDHHALAWRVGIHGMSLYPNRISPANV
jgi:uncharacterized membrane protein